MVDRNGRRRVKEHVHVSAMAGDHGVDRGIDGPRRCTGSNWDARACSPGSSTLSGNDAGGGCPLWSTGTDDAGWLTGLLAAWLADWLVGWLVGSLVGMLTGVLVGVLAMSPRSGIGWWDAY